MATPTLRTQDAIRPDTGELDLSKVGGNGLAFNLQALANNTPYVKNPLFIHLTRPPKAFKLHPQGDKLTAALKRLIEVHPRVWDGFNQVLEIETAQIPQGWDRQMLTIPTNVTRGPITPALTADKLYDEVDAKFWNYFIETFIGNTTTQRPNFAELNETPEDWLVDQYTFDIIAYEPNATYTKAIKAWACACMLPSNSVEVTGIRDTQNARVNEEYNIAFNTIYDGEQNIVDLATQLLQAQNINAINPIHKPAYFDTISADVEAAQVGILDEHLAASSTWNGNG
ncbi:hypothetical protein TSMG0112 [Halocynthia phage JM-2012]|uniref:virion structural protein n=1 Tax=Halocynthia phage JM-2012 TaxID=1173297 RepID=UPI00025C6944|nr:virion structural protein [Halocynthia phage JM-2012]AFI55395.1 hypothetical protein TSMG0112 [Halocynthia phage JM-2012]